MSDIAEYHTEDLCDDEWAEYRDDGLHVGKYPRCYRCSTLCVWHKQWNRDRGGWDFILVEKNRRDQRHSCPAAKPTDFPCLTAS